MVGSGHNHFYERSQAERSGYWVHYIVSGGGGAPTHSPVGQHENRLKAKEALHHCVIDINGTTATLNVLENDGSPIEEVILTPGQQSP